MFFCYCKRKFSKRKLLIKHLKNLESLKQFSLPTLCHQPNCLLGNTYHTYEYLSLHLENKHSCDRPNENLVENNNNEAFEIQIENLETDFHKDDSLNVIQMDFSAESDSNVKHVGSFLSKIKAEILDMIVNLKSKSVLSETLLNEIIENFSSVFASVIDSITQILFNR